MAKKNENKEVRLGLRVDESWHEAILAEASRIGVSVAAYIRMACIEKMDRDRARREADKRG